VKYVWLVCTTLLAPSLSGQQPLTRSEAIAAAEAQAQAEAREEAEAGVFPMDSGERRRATDRPVTPP